MLLVKNRLDQFVAPAGPPDEKYTSETIVFLHKYFGTTPKKEKNKGNRKKQGKSEICDNLPPTVGGETDPDHVRLG